MTETIDDERIDGETIRRMVRLVDPAWDVLEATPAENGVCTVYRVRLETPSASTREAYLKAPPDASSDIDGSGIPVGARLMAVLRTHTSIPVPAVLGVVENHPEVPSPFSLLEAIDGRDVAYESVGWMSDAALRTTARELGAYLGELHALEAVDAFGHVTDDASQHLEGGRPSGDLATLTVADGVDSWTAFLREWIDRELERHANSRFSSLTPALESWCDERVASLSGSFTPVLGRNDHGFHNLLLAPESGEITAMLDWAYTLAVTPRFDFEYAAYLFSGAFLSGIPDVPDRRELVRTAMLEGYRSTAPELYDAVATPCPLYELLAMVRVMNDFETLPPRLPDGTGTAAADGLREDAEAMLETEGT